MRKFFKRALNCHATCLPEGRFMAWERKDEKNYGVSTPTVFIFSLSLSS
ncbi:MAG: hypothetical protein IH852_14395 [Bacteroidetes bacterium]|nr:hypothetical protein [Bacteroidota bacterium]